MKPAKLCCAADGTLRAPQFRVIMHASDISEAHMHGLELRERSNAAHTHSICMALIKLHAAYMHVDMSASALKFGSPASVLTTERHCAWRSARSSPGYFATIVTERVDESVGVLPDHATHKCVRPSFQSTDRT